MRQTALSLALVLSVTTACGKREAAGRGSLTPDRSATSARIKPPGIAARVGNADITDAQVEEAYQRWLAERHAPPPDDPGQIASVKRSLAEGLAIEEALFRKAKALSLLPTPAELRVEVSKGRAQFASPEELDGYMASRKLTAADFEETIRRNMAIEKLFQHEVLSKHQPSDDETRAFYVKHMSEFYEDEAWRIAEIFVPFDGHQEEARKRIEEAQARIQRGEDFARVAAEMSSGPTKDRGGERGYLRRGGRLFLGDEQIFALQTGGSTPPIKSPNGYRIFKCLERRTPKQLTLDDSGVRKDCEEQLGQSRIDEYIRAVKVDANLRVY